MNPEVMQALALNRYAREGRYVSESWASDHFKTTYQAAIAACKDALDTTMGVTVSWNPSAAPDTISVRCSSIISERTSFLRTLPIAGELAQALLTDLTKLAVGQAVQDIRDEREQALVREASARVGQLMQQALTQEATV